MSGWNWLSLAADAVLLIHFAFVAFVTLGLAAIWIGWLRRWRFVRDLRFRVAHLACMGLVLLESVFGVVCPLTNWEKGLRAAAGQESYQETFMQHWIHKALFFEVPPPLFTAIYALFFTAIALSWFVVKPERKSG